MRPGLVVTFAQAYRAFIRAYERNEALQARCSAGENVDIGETVMFATCSRKLLRRLLRLPRNGSDNIRAIENSRSCI
jgi:hypothetical protein